jgi:ATP-binding cassette subfamily B protein
MNKNPYLREALLKRVITQVKPFRAYIVSLVILSFLAIPTALMRPYAIALIIDSAFGNKPLPSAIRSFFPDDYNFTFNSIIIIAIALVIIVALVQSLSSLASWIISSYVGENLVLDFRTRLFNHIQRLSLTYHDTIGTSDSLYKLQWDTVAIKTLLINNLIPLITAFVTLIAMTAVMFFINWRFALIALCIIPPLLFLVRASKSRLRRNWDSVKGEESRAMSVLHEVLSSLRVVKAFGQEKEEEKRFFNQARRAVQGNMKVAWVAALFDSALAMIITIGAVLFIFIGANYVHSGEMTLGEFLRITQSNIVAGRCRQN